MIYTITLNPALDCILETKKFEIGQTNYYDQDYSLIGGKGINVGVILNNLKTPVLITGFLGQENKDLFLNQFDQLNLKNHFFIFEGKTRTNFKIKNLAQKQETELNGVGTLIAPVHVQALLNYLEVNLKPNDIVIGAGSLPLGISSDIYFQIGQIVAKKQARFCLDTSKAQMLAGLKAHPYLIKPNLEEIGEILNQPVSKDLDLEGIKKLISQLKELGARNVLLSLGAQGSYFFAENDEVYQVGIAHGKLVNSVGAGDSMLGGFVYGLSQNFSLEQNLKYAAAAGGATAFNQWLATQAEIEAHVGEIDVKKI